MMFWEKLKKYMKDDKLYLHHIFDAATKVEEYLQEKTFEDFTSDDLLFDAVVSGMDFGELSLLISQKSAKRLVIFSDLNCLNWGVNRFKNQSGLHQMISLLN